MKVFIKLGIAFVLLLGAMQLFIVLTVGRWLHRRRLDSTICLTAWSARRCLKPIANCSQTGRRLKMALDLCTTPSVAPTVIRTRLSAALVRSLNSAQD